MRRRAILIFGLVAVGAIVMSGSAARLPVPQIGPPAPPITVGSVPFPLQPNSVRFAIIGDFGTGEKPQMELAQQMVKSRAEFPFEFAITVGDNMYTGSQPSDFELDFAVPYKALLEAGVSFYATLGNHDKTNERFYKPFNLDGANYYTFRKHNARFFALDSNYMDRTQVAWVETQLKGADATDWKICYFHHPLYSDARYHGSDIDLRRVLEPLFVRYGVNVVYSGHDHVYERVRPQQGIYYFIEGSSGSLRDGDLNKSANIAKGFDTDRTFTLVEITGDSLHFKAISRLGAVVDAGVIHRTILPPAGGGLRDHPPGPGAAPSPAVRH